MDIIINFLKENIFSIITAIVAITAISQTHRQIKISNKQFLFESRVRKYTLASSLIQLYKENQSLLDYSKSKDDEAIIVDFQFENLTNIGYLKDITGIIYEPKNNEEKTKFLLRLEEIKQVANEIRFLFNRHQGVLLKDFVNDYQNVLLELYKYQILQNLIKENKEPSIEPKTYPKLKKEFDETSHRERLYNAINQLKNSYEKLQFENAIEKIEKEIKL